MNISQILGKSTEMLISSKLLLENRELYIPAVDDHGVDMIVRTMNFDKNSINPSDHYEFQEIQVKSVSKGGLFAAIKCPNPTPNYWFVFYIKDIDRLWLINSMDFVKISSQVTKPGSKNFGSYSLDLKPTRKTPVKHSLYSITDFSKLP